MTITHSKSRRNKILEAVILAYAESASPVGSEFLWQNYDLGVSPATIRNEMAELEAQGLITHPHTSAGRIPTDRGYRYYVDLLMDLPRLRPEEEHWIDSIGRLESDDPAEFLAGAARVLSEVSREAGVVLAPRMAQGSFRRLELIPVDRREIVGVLIATEGLVKHGRMELVEALEPEELERLERFLNEELAGMPLDQVPPYLERSLLETTSAFFHLHKRAADLLRLGPFFQEEPSVILEGMPWILEAPEFQEVSRTRWLLKALEEKRQVEEILRRDLSAGEVSHHIGSENREPAFVDCTLVAAPYRLRGGVAGTIGVIGPTRMNYPRVTKLVERMAQAVTRTFQ